MELQGDILNAALLVTVSPRLFRLFKRVFPCGTLHCGKKKKRTGRTYDIVADVHGFSSQTDTDKDVNEME